MSTIALPEPHQVAPDKYAILRTVSFGQRVAEEETEFLSTYFVETDQWLRLYRGDIDVIYGPKGSGKSALYSLLLSKSDQLFDRGILLIADENPRGSTAFKNLETDPPASEREFIALWKLYIAALLQGSLRDFGIKSEAATDLETALTREGLVKGHLSLAGLLQAVSGYVRRLFRPSSLEGSVSVDPLTQSPAFTGKITFADAENVNVDPEVRSVDRLLELANEAFVGAETSAWVLLDRLDVAFADNPDLESNALRALFRAYLDLGASQNIKLKIFLRTDI